MLRYIEEWPSGNRQSRVTRPEFSASIARKSLRIQVALCEAVDACALVTDSFAPWDSSHCALFSVLARPLRSRKTKLPRRFRVLIADLPRSALTVTEAQPHRTWSQRVRWALIPFQRSMVNSKSRDLALGGILNAGGSSPWRAAFPSREERRASTLQSCRFRWTCSITTDQYEWWVDAGFTTP